MHRFLWEILQVIMPVRGRSNSLGGVRRDGNPVIPRLGQDLTARRFMVSKLTLTQVSRMIEKRGVSATRTLLQNQPLSYPEEVVNAMFAELQVSDTPPSSPEQKFKEEDLQKVIDEEQGLVDNLKLTGTDEEKLETLEIAKGELKKKKRELRTVIDYLKKRSPEQEEALQESFDQFREKVREHLEVLAQQWDELGINARHAADTQALLHLKREYCDKKSCK